MSCKVPEDPLRIAVFKNEIKIVDMKEEKNLMSSLLLPLLSHVGKCILLSYLMV